MLVDMNTTETVETGRKTYQMHPYSERLAVVSLYEQGYGSKRIAKMMGIDDSLIRTWLRKYRAGGKQALEPYRRSQGSTRSATGVRACSREENETLFKRAYSAYASTLEPVASIARRYRLDYHSFLYHVQRYHPEFKEQRKCLRQSFLP